MNFLDCLKTRRSVRAFTDMPVPHAIASELVELASYSPSWKHTQIVRYTFVDSREIMDKLADEMVLDFKFNTKVIHNAPALFVVSYVTNRSGFERDGSFSTPKGDGFEMFDAGVASQSLSLAAHSMGLGTVIMGYFDEEKIAELLDLPDGQKIGAVIAIGYPAVIPKMPPRKPVADLLTFK